MMVNQLIRSATSSTLPRPRYAYIGPYYRQVKDIAWDYLRHYGAQVPGTTFNESELRADFVNSARIKLLGADNADSLRGIYLDGVVLDEYAQIAPSVWGEVIRPALGDRRGWAVFIGTPRGRNHFHELFERAGQLGYPTALYRASETSVVPEDELRLAREMMTPEEYAQEYECAWDAALKGAYYSRELEAARAAGRIRAFEWEPAVSVDTVWDLGINDSTAILFVQRTGREVRIIEAYEDRGKSLDHYAHVLQSRPYVYGRHYLPHDVEVRELSSGRTRLDFLTGLGVRPITVLAGNDVADGIAQARLLFPRVWFNEPKCRGLIEALSSYRAEWDAKKMVFKDQPLHDWASHMADAFRYLAVSGGDIRGSGVREPRLPSNVDFDPFHVQKPRGRTNTSWDVFAR